MDEQNLHAPPLSGGYIAAAITNKQCYVDHTAVKAQTLNC